VELDVGTLKFKAQDSTRTLCITNSPSCDNVGIGGLLILATIQKSYFCAMHISGHFGLLPVRKSSQWLHI